MKKIGINKNENFVCIAIRDSYYLNKVLPTHNWTYHNFKNSDIENYNKAVKYLNDINIKVIRMGAGSDKSWSLENFINLAYKILDKNKIPVFFIEKNKTEIIEKIKYKLPNALFPEHHSNIACPALVTALSSRLDLAISIDNGVMHMMGLANIPMIVLFGPTDSEKFAPRINSIKILDSKKNYNSKDINRITVLDVFKLV